MINDGDLFNFFRNHIAEAAPQLNEPIKAYIVDIMVDYGANVPTDEITCLSILDTIHDYKRLRDRADAVLFLTGYFREFMKKRMLPLQYYYSIGADAYNRLSAIVWDSKGVYPTLSQNISKISDILWGIKKRVENNRFILNF